VRGDVGHRGHLMLPANVNGATLARLCHVIPCHTGMSYVSVTPARHASTTRHEGPVAMATVHVGIRMQCSRTMRYNVARPRPRVERLSRLASPVRVIRQRRTTGMDCVYVMMWERCM